MTPPLLTEEEGPPILKELNPGVIYANTPPPILAVVGGQDLTIC
jgi:hypothetical protein